MGVRSWIFLKIYIVFSVILPLCSANHLIVTPDLNEIAVASGTLVNLTCHIKPDTWKPGLRWCQRKTDPESGSDKKDILLAKENVNKLILYLNIPEVDNGTSIYCATLSNPPVLSQLIKIRVTEPLPYTTTTTARSTNTNQRVTITPEINNYVVGESVAFTCRGNSLPNYVTLQMFEKNGNLKPMWLSSNYSDLLTFTKTMQQEDDGKILFCEATWTTHEPLFSNNITLHVRKKQDATDERKDVTPTLVITPAPPNSRIITHSLGEKIAYNCSMNPPSALNHTTYTLAWFQRKDTAPSIDIKKNNLYNKPTVTLNTTLSYDDNGTSLFCGVFIVSDYITKTRPMKILIRAEQTTKVPTTSTRKPQKSTEVQIVTDQSTQKSTKVTQQAVRTAITTVTKTTTKATQKTTTDKINDANGNSGNPGGEFPSKALIWLITGGVFLLALFFLLAIYCIRRRKLNNVYTHEVETYACPTTVLYAELEVTNRSFNSGNARDEAPYAEIIGVLAPKKKSNT